MFRSKTRPTIISQYEHGRLSGVFASMWGNDRFSRPAIQFEPFVQGVALHDWAYGVTDNLPIGELAEGDWLDVARRGTATIFDDPVTDIVAKLHLRRLLQLTDSAERKALISQIDSHIERRLPETGHTRLQFEWADTITRFCDTLAFDFSFEAPVTRSLRVHTKVSEPELTAVEYSIQSGGGILVKPWPFALHSFSGILVGYRLDGYPDRLRPVTISYQGRQTDRQD